LRNAEGRLFNDKGDKKVWILWAEGRVNGDFETIGTPIGNIPKYDDLKILFDLHLGYDYTEGEYTEQFSIRIAKYIEKMTRMTRVFGIVKTPKAFKKELKDQIYRLEQAREDYGSVISPFEL